jgi:phytoene desaturase
MAGRAVIANLDVATVYERLLPPGSVPAPAVRALTGAETSCSGFILLLGVQGEHPELAHHNIFFSADYPAEFEAIFRRGLPPRDPTIYVAITSKTDDGHAPAGCENWFVMANAPALGAGMDWQAQAGAYRDLLLEKLAGRGLDVRGQIVCEQRLTPLEIERLTGARRGALYGRSSNERLSAFRRPANRCPHLRGLYFAGGTTHPGGGAPMVTLSGKVAASLVLGDLR